MLLFCRLVWSWGGSPIFLGVSKFSGGSPNFRGLQIFAPSDTVNERPVRTLLECILLYVRLDIYPAKVSARLYVESLILNPILLQAGVYTIADGYNLYDIINNPEKISQQLAEETPAWEPGIYKNCYSTHLVFKCLY